MTSKGMRRTRKARGALKKYWADPKWRKRQLELVAKAKSTPESKRKRSEASKRLWESPAHRKSFTEKAEQRYADPVFLAKFKKAIADGMRRKFQDPEYREKHLKGHRSEKFKAAIGAARIAEIQKNYKPNANELFLDSLLRAAFPGEFRLNVTGDVVIGGKIPDFINTNGKKVVVELFGSFYHGQRRTGRTRTEEEENRRNHFAKWGFRTFITWDKVLYANPESELLRLERFLVEQ